MDEIRLVIISLILLTITGCANSANHRIVPLTMAGDSTLDCDGIKYEKIRLNTIIDGVEQDKNDMTGSDLVDGLLYFPFNIIAKQSNYSNAVKAAEERKAYLDKIYSTMGCHAEETTTKVAIAIDKESIRQTKPYDKDTSEGQEEFGDVYKRIKYLKQLLDNDLITQQEYTQKKSELLDKI